jgi:hypothetical protein
MERQQDGSLASSLRDHGVRYIVLGEVSEEWYLYSIAHTISSPSDFAPNLERYFSPELVEKLLGHYPPLPPTATEDEIIKRFGDLLSCVQVYLPLRVLARDLRKASFPFLRYRICWTPEQDRPLGELVSTGVVDLCLIKPRICDSWDRPFVVGISLAFPDGETG